MHVCGIYVRAVSFQNGLTLGDRLSILRIQLKGKKLRFENLIITQHLTSSPIDCCPCAVCIAVAAKKLTAHVIFDPLPPTSEFCKYGSKCCPSRGRAISLRQRASCTLDWAVRRTLRRWRRCKMCTQSLGTKSSSLQVRRAKGLIAITVDQCRLSTKLDTQPLPQTLDSRLIQRSVAAHARPYKHTSIHSKAFASLPPRSKANSSIRTCSWQPSGLLLVTLLCGCLGAGERASECALCVRAHTCVP
jgi:hypothetical protein